MRAAVWSMIRRMVRGSNHLDYFKWTCPQSDCKRESRMAWPSRRPAELAAEAHIRRYHPEVLDA